MEDVDGDEHAVRHEGRLVDDGVARGERGSRGLDARGEVAVREIDEGSPRDVGARDVAHVGAMVEDRLPDGIVDLKLRCVALVNGQPQPEMALQTRRELGLRQAHDLSRRGPRGAGKGTGSGLREGHRQLLLARSAASSARVQEPGSPV